MVRTVISQKTYAETIELLRSKYYDLTEDGNFFVIYSTEYDSKGNVLHDFFEIIDEAVTIGYKYVNTIVYPALNKHRVSIVDNVRYIVWLCKNRMKVAFNKDVIREKHIWKDVEWGKREKNYNPKGKDPGNVWIPTKDDGKANITEHILLSEQEVINRLIAMSECENSYEMYVDDISSVINVDNSIIDTSGGEEKNKSGIVYFKSSEDMTDIDDKTVKVVITSPPYWNLKDYFKEGQIGQEPYDKYLSRMKSVWRMCYNKLDDDGSLWVNINIRVQNGEVILIPNDFVKMCKDIGFFYKGIIIWHKSSGIPTGEKNIVDRHEYVLVFSKSEEFNVTLKQKVFADYKNSELNGAAFWNINRKAGSVGKKFIHPAIYPNELVKRIVLMTTLVGDMVLDPFLGSGTSMIAALQCNRNCIGYEFNEGFKSLMESRFENELEPSCEVIFEAENN